MDGTTEDGMFSLESCRCVQPAVLPVMMINGEVHGRLVPDDIPKILKNIVIRNERFVSHLLNITGNSIAADATQG